MEALRAGAETVAEEAIVIEFWLVGRGKLARLAGECGIGLLVVLLLLREGWR